jgi:sulfonate transport system permease protein
VLASPAAAGRRRSAVPAAGPTRRRLRAAAAGLVVPLAVLVLWAALSRAGLLPDQILPPPAQVWETGLSMWRDGEIARHASVSLLRVVQGFALGATAGLALGLAMGLWPAVEDYARPLFTAVAQVPALGWVPLLMLVVGIDEALKVMVIAKAAFVPVTLNTFGGVRAVPPAYLEVARVFRFDRGQLLRRVVLPAAVPPIFTGVRYGLTHAWLALVAVELLASSEGLGYLLVWGRQMFWLDTVIVAMAVIGVVGLVMDRALGAVEARLQRWRALDLEEGRP